MLERIGYVEIFIVVIVALMVLGPLIFVMKIIKKNKKAAKKE